MDLRNPRRLGPELVFGLVGATGTDLSRVCRLLDESLNKVAYKSIEIHLIDLLTVFKKWKTWPEDGKQSVIKAKMDAGDEFCSSLGVGDAIAKLGITKIRDERKRITGLSTTPAPNTAFIFRSLKRRDEVDLLRATYRQNFYLIGAFSPRPERVSVLARKIADANHSASSDHFRAAAEELVQRDLDDKSKRLGQHVGDTFHLADVFVDTSDEENLAHSVERFIRLVFGHPFHTPTRHEYGMFHAQSAALRSCALGRQVGAAISTNGGSLIAVGTNDVPRAGGGEYWEGDNPDRRDYAEGQDSSDIVKRYMVEELFERLQKNRWLAKALIKTSSKELARRALKGPSLLKGTQITRIIEYGRTIHAEMSAIVDAARRGVSIQGGWLYTTTYPCHNCARHIIAAGIGRVVYLEPYPKSLTAELHKDSMVNDSAHPSLVGFTAFVGVAPRKYLSFFEMPLRKREDGRVVRWDPEVALPRESKAADITYITDELVVVTSFVTALKENGFEYESARSKKPKRPKRVKKAKEVRRN